jgi:hypothetical protein
MAGEDSEPEKCVQNWWEHILRSEKYNFDENSGVQKVQNWINCRNPRNSEWTSQPSPPKTFITNPWECLCVDLIGLYTLKGKDSLQIDFMALNMIDPASS